MRSFEITPSRRFVFAAGAALATLLGSCSLAFDPDDFSVVTCPVDLPSTSVVCSLEQLLCLADCSGEDGCLTTCLADDPTCLGCVGVEIADCAADVGCQAAVDAFSCCLAESCDGNLDCAACDDERDSAVLCASAVSELCTSAGLACFPPTEETCDGFDNDADGEVDEAPTTGTLCDDGRLCTAGTCAAECGAETADCDDNLTCETTIADNPQACGECDRWCNSGFCGNLSCVSQLVDVAPTHGCALVLRAVTPFEAELWCWGQGDRFGMSGRVAPTPVELPEGMAEPYIISVGEYGTCVVDVSGAAACALDGEDFTQMSARPTLTTTTDTFTGAHIGRAHACLRSVAANVYCWGDNSLGQLGRRVSADLSQPLPSISGVFEIGGGPDYTCARAADTTVRCWGDNSAAQLGDRDSADDLCPTTGENCVVDPRVVETEDGEPLDGVLQVFSTATSSCAALSPLDLECWGSSALGGTEPVDFPTQLEAFDEVPSEDLLTLAGGESHVCALARGGAVHCVGSNDRAQLGVAASTSSAIPLSASVNEIAAGGDTTCALYGPVVAEGAPEVYCWGANDLGQAGQPEGDTLSTPTHIAEPE